MNIPKLKKPTLQQLASFDMTKLFQFIPKDNYHSGLLIGEAGKEHYRLLSWLSYRFNPVRLCEFGTLAGLSAAALCHNEKAFVVTHDVRFYDDLNKDFAPNCYRRLVPALGCSIDDPHQFPFMFYDTQHDGNSERDFVNDLIKQQWSGVVMFDDIHLNDAMKSFWKGLTFVDKEDWSDVGHHSGTGIVYF